MLIQLKINLTDSRIHYIRKYKRMAFVKETKIIKITSICTYNSMGTFFFITVFLIYIKCVIYTDSI